ncbi:MAG: deoxyribose-phosphate aldolase [Bacteroidetes bacterium]|nr:deoxyribose-phosphate aldolase [Bacteroidota bacterium]
MDDYRAILSCIDLTTLEGSDNTEKIVQLCRKAISFGQSGLPFPAAVCVYPLFVRLAKKELDGTGIRVAAVAGAFPSGQSPLELRVKEVVYAVQEGADEIDMVISRGRMLEGDEKFVFDEIAAIREAAKDIHLKVILETGELKKPDLIRRASEIAISAGADFIKTSTGKIQPAATEEAMQIMLEVIRDHHEKTGRRIGIKPAGGISEPEQALRYYKMTEQILGTAWLDKDLFRIGASRLADALAKEISSEPHP